MNPNDENVDICCPPFESNNWDNKIYDWSDKKFIRDKVFTFLYMPIGFGKVMSRLDTKVRAAGATVPDWLCLSEHTSSWNMNLLLAVDKEVEGAVNKTISGKFFSKVYEGPFQNTEKWTKDFEKVLADRQLKAKKQYMWYTTCPKCAKKYGNNYVVIFGELL